MGYLGNGPMAASNRTTVEGTATAGQTTFAVPGGYIPPMIDVFVGGAALNSDDYTATDGMSVTLKKAMAAGTAYKATGYGAGVTSSATANATRTVVENTATAGQNTIVIPGGCIAGMTDVFIDGVRLPRTDYSDASGTQVTLATPMVAGQYYTVLAWAPGVTPMAPVGQMAGFRNRLHNGDGRVTQRMLANLTGTVGWGFGLADRWQGYQSGTGATLQLDAVAASLGGLGLRNWLRAVSTVAASNVSGNNLIVPFCEVIEGQDCFDLGNQPFTLSFLFYATVAGTYSVGISCYNVSQQQIGAYTTSFQYTTASTVQAVSVTIPAGNLLSLANGIQSGMRVNVGAINTGNFQTTQPNTWRVSEAYYTVPGSTNWATAPNNLVMITDVQLEPGTVATPFERRPFALELALCQRYFEVCNFILFQATQNGVTGNFGGTVGTVSFKARKRVNAAQLRVYAGPDLGLPADSVQKNGGSNMPSTAITLSAYSDSIRMWNGPVPGLTSPGDYLSGSIAVEAEM